MHENAGNLGMRVYSIKDLIDRLDVNILAMTYRGYDPNEGSPTEEGLKLDGEAINMFLNDTANSNHPEMESYIDQDKIILFGRSLGAAVSTYMVNKSPDLYSGLHIEGAFLSISKEVNSMLIGWIVSPVKWLLLANFWENDKEI